MIRQHLKTWGFRKNKKKTKKTTAVNMASSTEDTWSGHQQHEGQIGDLENGQDDWLMISSASSNAPTTPGDSSESDSSRRLDGGAQSALQLSPRISIRTPDQILYYQTAASIRDFCLFYVNSADLDPRHEPPIHRNTPHAIFAQHMQDSITFCRQSKMALGIFCARKAFLALESVLLNPHPMGLALLMAVICDLSRHGDIMNLIWHQLLDYLRDFPVERLSTRAWMPLFKAYREVPLARMDLTIRCMRVIRNNLSESLGRSNWMSLYTEERLCDGLYYAGDEHENERISTRQNLLRDQEGIYPKDARNVLWTLTNVAEDHLQWGRFDRSEELYRDAFERADRSYQGFDRAKTCFAALDGLANAQMARTGLVCWPYENWRVVRPALKEDYGAILRTQSLLDDAEREAQWFEPESRRMARTLEKLDVLRFLMPAQGTQW